MKKLLIFIFVSISIFMLLMYKPWEKDNDIPINKILARDKSIVESCTFPNFQVLELLKNGRFSFYDINKNKQLKGKWEKHFLYKNTLIFKYKNIKEIVMYDSNKVHFKNTTSLFGCRVISVIFIENTSWPTENFI